MAHVVVEWTDNLLADGFEIKPVLSLIAEHLREAEGVFPLGGIRVRGVKLNDYVVADGAADDAFINITVLMGPGRSEEFKKRCFDALFERVSEHFEPLFDKRYLAVSMYINEAVKGGSYKKNNIHKRFK